MASKKKSNNSVINCVKVRLHPTKEQKKELDRLRLDYRWVTNMHLAAYGRLDDLLIRKIPIYHEQCRQIKDQISEQNDLLKGSSDHEKVSIENKIKSLLTQLGKTFLVNFPFPDKEIMSKTYKQVREDIYGIRPDIPSSFISEAKNSSKELYNTYRTELFKGGVAGVRRASLKSFRHEAGAAKLIRGEDGSLYVSIPYINKYSARSDGTLASRRMTIRASFSHKNPQIEEKIEALVGKKIETTTTFCERNNKWTMSIPLRGEVQKKVLDETRSLSVYVPQELEEGQFLAMAPSNDLNRVTTLEGTSAIHLLKQLKARRRLYQNSYRDSSEGSRIGHGRKRALAPIEKLQEKKNNFCRTWNQQRAAKIVQTAIDHRCSRILMTDLVEMDSRSLILQDWPYYEFMSAVEFAAKKVGISFLKTKPLSGALKEIEDVA